MATGEATKRERTCVGCGAKAGKAGLFRIVRCADGSVAFDATGRRAGRGAYVCSPSCFEAALKTGRLQRALRAPLEHEDAMRAASQIASASAASVS